MSRITIVDESDKPIGSKERDLVGPEDIYRVAAIWITSPRGTILMAQRAAGKKHSPGKWAAAVVGTVEDGEDYKTNAVKEATEEIGLTVHADKLHEGPLQRIRIPNPTRNYFCQWFYYTTDMPIEVLELKADEVADLKWFSKDELLELMDKQPTMFVESAQTWMKEVMAKRNPDEE